MTSIEDAELLRLSATGDQVAFGEFMDRHADVVFRFLRSLHANPDDAEDALQESFISAWRSAATYEGRGSARGWLLAIARNCLRRQHRRRSGAPAEFETLEKLGRDAGWGVQSDFTGALETQDLLHWGLAQLPDDERQVLLLRDVHGLTGEEAATMLELSVPAMKSRLHRGRLRLMGILRKEEGCDG